MILELDIGNSRVKWRIVNGTVSERSGRFSHRLFQEDGIDRLGKLTGVKRLRVACVADSLKPDVDKLAEHLAIQAEYAVTTAHCAGVHNSYRNPQAMGVDRWLAMLAAFDLQHKAAPQSRVCVIDCGTSLTIDYVAVNGEHEGGLILPGRQLLLNSLQRNTEKVLFDPQTHDGQFSLGRNTEDAVLNGAVHMMAGAIHESFDRASQGAACQFFLCGGDALWLQPALRMKAILVPDLVLDGLQLSLP